MKLKPWLEKYNELTGLYESESDRALGILAASFLEDRLAAFLKDHLVSHARIDDLFVDPAPLGAFSSRINMAFALGILAEPVRADLHQIRKIRNHFAHTAREASFDLPPVCDHCSALQVPALFLPPGVLHDIRPRDKFQTAVATINLTLEMTKGAQPQVPEYRRPRGTDFADMTIDSE